MISTTLFRILLITAILLYALLLALGGTTLPANYYAPIGTVTAIIILILGLFDRYLWKLPGFHQLFSTPPNIQGTWKGEFRSSWVDPQTNERKPPIEIYAVVRQTYSSISIKMFTAESSSTTLAASIKTEDGTHKVWAVYLNTPDQEFRAKSEIHHGGFLMTVVGSPVLRLKGSYWTDRLTRGEVSFLYRTDAVCDDFLTCSTSKYQ